MNFLNKRKEKLSYILDLPKKGSNFPGIILCHGFAKAKSDKKFVQLSKALTKQGIAVFRFDFSGHGFSEGSIENLDIVFQAEEIKSAYDVFLQNKKINKKKIIILGHSLGALSVVLFQLKYKLAKGLILVSPALCQKELIKKWYTKQEIYLWRKQEFLETKKGRLGIKYLNQALLKDWQNTASRIKIPVLLIHGKKDEDIPVKYTKNLFSKLNCEKTLKIIESAEHHFKNKQSRDKLIKIVVDWISLAMA